MSSTTTAPTVLTIAGSDPSGGAGIQADLKTFAVHNVYGMSVITALTSQNTTGVSDIHVIPAPFVESQIKDVVTDISPKCIKTGMLASQEIIKVVAAAVKDCSVPVIVDPVMVSTSGSTLLPQDATKAYLSDLLPHTTLLTPNLPEALLLAQLAGQDFGSVEKLSRDRRYELATFLTQKVQWVLLKGGHAPLEINGEKVVIDILVNANGQSKEFVSQFSSSKNTHGTGCTLASAVASNIALGYEMEVAVQKAIDFVQGAIMHSYPLGKGNGPLNHLYRQRNLPFTPGKFYDYLLSHPRIVPIWHEYTHHSFLSQLAAGTLPLPAFRHYLVQDYHFLTHFSRSTALSAYKSTSLPRISAAAKIMLHIQTEVKLHLTLCKEYGVPDEEMERGEEDLACVAYTRWVTDVGGREDWFGLQVAMMPCLFGYGVIARRLFDDKTTKREGNGYFRWIKNYVAEDYVEAVNIGRKLLEENAVKRSPERVEEIVEIFREGARLEGLFWGMGLEHHEKMQKLAQK